VKLRATNPLMRLFCWLPVGGGFDATAQALTMDWQTSMLSLRCSQDVYFDPPEHPVTKSSFGCMSWHREGLSLVKVLTDILTDTHCHVQRAPNALLVSFRGTSSYENWMTDLKTKQMPLSALGDMALEDAQVEPCDVHQGFLEAYRTVRAEMLECVASFLQSGQLITRIIVTGHSLGGAAAVLVAWLLHQQGFSVERSSRLAAPRSQTRKGPTSWTRCPS